MSKKKDKRNKVIFSGAFCTTIVVSLFLLIVCAIHDQMLMWVECALLSIWAVFSMVFTYAIIHKWECLREEGYSPRVGRVSKEDQWKASIVCYVITLIITFGFLIHLIVRIAH